MKPVSQPVRRCPPANPEIVRKVRRAHAAYVFSDSLPGEQDHDYLPRTLPQPRRLGEFGRPGL